LREAGRARKKKGSRKKISTHGKNPTREGIRAQEQRYLRRGERRRQRRKEKKDPGNYNNYGVPTQVYQEKKKGGFISKKEKYYEWKGVTKNAIHGEGS